MKNELHTQGQETLPFEIHPAQSKKDFQKVTQIRVSAYARHLPEFAARLHVLEAADSKPGTVVLLATAKSDGRAVGTMRLQSNWDEPLPLEQSKVLPDWLQACQLVEATRLAVEASAVGALARNALFKACYLYSEAAKIDWLVVTARKPLDRIYEGLYFQDVFPDSPDIPMQHVANLPHRVMALNVPQAKRLWSTQGHPLFHYMTGVEHPDVFVVAESARALACAA